MYTLTMRCEDGGDETLTVQAQDLDDARVIARDAVEDWVRDGAWGPEGTTVRAWWRLHDAEGEEVASGDLTVTIDPDHQTLIRDAVGPYNEAVCGLDPSDHDWTSVGEGGCAENPGVWSPGGTTLVFRSHCRRCGLMRIEQIAGSQRNPGDSDTTKYEMADEATLSRWREIGAMEPDERGGDHDDL